MNIPPLMTEAAYNSMVKDTLLPVYNRVAERDMHEAANGVRSSFQVTIDEEDISDVADTGVK